jgi:threonine aldolase
MRYDFASDNTAPVAPEAREAMDEAGGGSMASYGEDPWTARAADQLRDLFETDCDVYFVFNGTAANSLALAAMCQSYNSVLCHEAAHIVTDECGAPEFFSNGTKLLTIAGEHGKLRPDHVAARATERHDLHFPRPRALSITQPTELGTVYTVDELHALGDTARSLGLRLHVDGARFANAVVTLGCSPRRLTVDAGVDVLCFGGTKLGMGLGEAVVFFDRALADDFSFRCKQAGQLASKMRYLTAPWATMLASGAWLRHAAHANAMAARLAAGLVDAGLELVHPPDANAVFVDLPDEHRRRVEADGWVFYDFIGGGSRFVCSWATTEAAVDELLASLRGRSPR